MVNPFKKRATEYLHDDAEFLSVFAPETLSTFSEKHAEEGKLYDRLSMIVGTSGSGKTMISRLLQYQTIQTLLENPSSTNKSLTNALIECGIIEKSENTSSSKFVGCRISMEAEYRDFWELPYDTDIKMGLLQSFLQAQTMILWLKGIESASNVDLSSVEIEFHEGDSATENNLEGINGKSLLEKARNIEKHISEVVTDVKPLSEIASDSILIEPYCLFDAIKCFVVDKKNSSAQLRPMVMLDDVHTLHSEQLSNLINWLAEKERKIARWIFMRLDTIDKIKPVSIFSRELNTNYDVEHQSHVKESKKITYVWLQNLENRKKMAKTMANKYLSSMSVFTSRGLTNFSDLHSTEVSPMSNLKIKKLKHEVEQFVSETGITQEVYQKFEKAIEVRFSSKKTIDNSEDMKLAMLYIILNIYVKKFPQRSLFDQDDSKQTLLKFKPKPNAKLIDAARIFLMHKYNRPYYYGTDFVCQSSGNAEQFLQLFSRLVSKLAILSPKKQHELLKRRAAEMVKEWDFPKSREVKKLCKFMAKECSENLKKNLKTNAPLNGGKNAFGIPQDEFEKILSERQYSELREILKFGMEYNAITIKPRHSSENKLWTLIELSGPVIISHDLTLSRGEFLEGTVNDLLSCLK